MGKARDLGVVDAIVVDAREEFARDYVLPAIKANALYGGGYPLFTALGRPLIAKLAVEHAPRRRLRHGRPRLHREGQRPGAASRPPWRRSTPSCKVIAPVREWQMGREEEIAYAREHGIPVKGGTETPPYSIDDNLWGRSSEGRSDRGPGLAGTRRRVSLGHAAPRTRRTSRSWFGSGSRRGRPVSLERRARSGWSSCSSGPRSSARGTGSGSSIRSRIEWSG